MEDGRIGALGVLVRQHVEVELKYVQEIVTIRLRATVVPIVKGIIARLQFARFNLALVIETFESEMKKKMFRKRIVFVAVNGGWSDWSPWTPCSKTCGKGQKYRRRECNSPKPINGGSVCEGSNFEMKNCKIHSCRNADLVKTGRFVCG